MNARISLTVAAFMALPVLAFAAFHEWFGWGLWSIAPAAVVLAGEIVLWRRVKR